MSTDLLAEDKTANWIMTNQQKLTRYEASGNTSSVGRMRWSDQQTAVLEEATRHLGYPSTTEQINNAVLTNRDCQDIELSIIFRRSQIKDKFRNIRLKANRRKHYVLEKNC